VPRISASWKAASIGVVWLAALGVVLRSYAIGQPVPWPFPQITVVLGVITALVILLILPRRADLGVVDSFVVELERIRTDLQALES
jgi:membrane protein YdbS with pleckstrin-like domain